MRKNDRPRKGEGKPTRLKVLMFLFVYNRIYSTYKSKKVKKKTVR